MINLHANLGRVLAGIARLALVGAKVEHKCPNLVCMLWACGDIISGAQTAAEDCAHV